MLRRVSVESDTRTRACWHGFGRQVFRVLALAFGTGMLGNAAMVSHDIQIQQQCAGSERCSTSFCFGLDAS